MLKYQFVYLCRDTIGSWRLIIFHREDGHFQLFYKGKCTILVAFHAAVVNPYEPSVNKGFVELDSSGYQFIMGSPRRLGPAGSKLCFCISHFWLIFGWVYSVFGLHAFSRSFKRCGTPSGGRQFPSSTDTSKVCHRLMPFWAQKLRRLPTSGS